MALSQYVDPKGAFSYYSSLLRGSSTDVFVIYGQAVRSVLMVFRPFYLGYLFLSPAKGLSFFWCSRMIALLLVSFEMGMLLTNKKKSMALAYSLLLGFAPTVQWWFATNGLVEMLIYIQLTILLVDAYMRTTQYGRRILYALVAVVCAGGYVLVFYPAWQVPLAYVLLVLLVWVIHKNWKGFSFQWKKDIPILFLFLVLLGLGMALLLSRSWDTIQATLNTVYPGKRNSSGGMELWSNFAAGFDLVMPLTQSSSGFNSCESSHIYDFAPAGLILAGIVVIKEKKKDLLLIGLTLVLAILTLYQTLGFPDILGQITLLGMSMPGRVMQVIGFLNLLMLFYAKSKMETRISVFGAAGLAVLLDGVELFCINRSYGTYLEDNTTAWAVIAVVQFLGFFAVFYHPQKRGRGVLAIAVVVAILGGLYVNPVQKGLDVVYESDLYKAIRMVAEEDPSGTWTTDCLGYPMNDFAIMAGASSVDSLSTYPNLEQWAVLGGGRKWEKIYNRYAHIGIQLQREKTQMKLTGNDAFQVNLAVWDMKKLGIDYVISLRDLTTLNGKKVTFEPCGSGDRMMLYRVKYR